MPRALPDPAFWAGRRVLVTGHTGFKGRWLALWLRALGAEVTGFARRDGGRRHRRRRGPRRRSPRAAPRSSSTSPALATVQLGYEDPAAVYTVNVVGTANVLQAVRESGSVRAVVGVTSDKCYLDQGSEWAYREDDRLGGYDPYSSSKAAQELVIAAFRDSCSPRGIAVASARAGNVIGGGDDTRRPARARPRSARRWPASRSRSARRDARRPWQHVLNPLEGYLLLAERLPTTRPSRPRWNFGPDEETRARSAGSSSACARAGRAGSTVALRRAARRSTRPRSRSVDSTRARTRLGWRPPWDLAAAIDATVEWHLAHRDGRDRSRSSRSSATPRDAADGRLGGRGPDCAAGDEVRV